MRITEIRVPDGTDGRGYPGDVKLDISGDFPGDVSEAIEVEHPSGEGWGLCDSTACDICQANEAGFPLSAGMLLQGATETPVLSGTVRAHVFNGTVSPGGVWEPADWQEWVEYFRETARECQACGSFNFPPEWGDLETCGNCAEPLCTLADLRADFRGQWGGGDKWGSAMCYFFEIADEMERRGDCQPDAWEYRPGAAGPPKRGEDADWPAIYSAPSSVLETMGNILHRLTNRIRSRGEDY